MTSAFMSRLSSSFSKEEFASGIVKLLQKDIHSLLVRARATFTTQYGLGLSFPDNIVEKCSGACVKDKNVLKLDGINTTRFNGMGKGKRLQLVRLRPENL